LWNLSEPDDIGKVALFLPSDLASYLTGSRSSWTAALCLPKEETAPVNAAGRTKVAPA
jgi:hypothetical protein